MCERCRSRGCPAFPKTPFAGAVREAGIEHRHFKAPGAPADRRAAARRGDHACLARNYAGQLELPEAIAVGAALADLAAARKVALLSYERAASGCHQTLLREAVLLVFAAIDLEPDDPA
jgi:hypothetical protein